MYPLVLVLLLERAEQNVNGRRPRTAGASATVIFGSSSRNRQHTSDGIHRRGTDSRLGRRSDYQAVSSVSAAATMVKFSYVQ